MMNRPTSIAYIDLLSVCFAFFVMLAALLMVQNADFHGDVPNKAEFVILMTWPDNSPSDMDLWLQDPTGQLIYFKNKDTQLVTLDRDDQGIGQNTILMPDGTRISDPHRSEMMSIRGIVPGTYIVNTLMYRKGDDHPIPVHIQVLKLNPYSVVTDRDIVFDHTTQEETVVTFTIDENGNIINKDETTHRQLVR